MALPGLTTSNIEIKWFALIHTVFMSTSTKNHIAKTKSMGKNNKAKKLLCKM